MKVVPHRPWRRFGVIAVSVSLVFALTGAGFWVGQASLPPRVVERPGEVVPDPADRQEISRLERELADSMLARQVDSGATEQLRGTIKGLRDEIGVLNEEVQFYKRLMAPSDTDQGLRIERFALERAVESDGIEYSLLLTQIVDRHSWIQGSVEIEVIGANGESEQILTLSDIQPLDAYPLKFRFRYFQDFKGGVTMPEGFEPDRVMVTARTGGSNGKQLQRTFDWNVLEG